MKGARILRPGKSGGIKGGRPSRNHGFTLVELLVACAVLSVLFATAYANLIGAQVKAKTAGMLENMHSVQVAAEAAATDSQGIFPSTPTLLGPYMPNGSNSSTGSVGTFPTNPFTEVTQEVPFVETISTTDSVNSTRAAAPTQSPGTKGQVGYNAVDPGAGSYCVTGCTVGGLRHGTDVTTTVLSNH